ncbi:hypothetical protein AGMMS50262_07050 [Bacteroidia bacterium]|nr:hypothetical protein AGMMS50262_07050 [Bacteroidia bacterium]
MTYYYGYPKTANEYIYVLCKNAQYKNRNEVVTTEMQVWKWDGTPIASFKINANLSAFNISEKYKKIYAVDIYHENIIYVFNLPFI